MILGLLVVGSRHGARETLRARGRRFEVAEGLKPGDRVAVAISGDLHDGATVEDKGEASTPALK